MGSKRFKSENNNSIKGKRLSDKIDRNNNRVLHLYIYDIYIPIYIHIGNLASSKNIYLYLTK